MNNDTFYRPPVTIAQCVIGTDKYPHSAIFLNYDYGDYFQRYGQIKEASKALTTEYILNTYISDDDFRWTNVNAVGEATNDSVYSLYVSDLRYQRNLQDAQPINVEFKILEDVPGGIHGYALVITKKLVSISSDGQRHFDLFQF